MQDRFKFRVWSKILSRYLGKNDPTQMIMENGYLAYLSDESMINYSIEQCTGLKDKNGKLIYEGDIVKNNKHMYQVEWYVNGFAVNDGYDYLIDNEEWEIIGNIHENPELLEKRDE